MSSSGSTSIKNLVLGLLLCALLLAAAYTLSSPHAPPSPPQGPQGYMYCTGGTVAVQRGGGSTITNATYFAPVNGSGISVWMPTSNSPLPSYGASCTAYGGYAYCVGGIVHGLASNTSYYAQLYTDGAGTWSRTSSFPAQNGSGKESCVTYASAIFCVQRGSNTESFANVSGDGIGRWQLQQHYSGASNLGSCTSYNDFAYCIGQSASGYYLYYSHISPITGFGQWQATNSLYPSGLGGAACVQSGGYLYCTGGSNSTGQSSQSYYTPLTTNGMVRWNSTTQYPIQTQDAACQQYGGYIYCVGSQYMSNTVYYAPLSQSGIGGWQTSQYPIAVSDPSCTTE